MSRPNKPRNPITGILVLDKPVGRSSMQAAAIAKSKAPGAKVGHAGTLDPLASGVLIVAFGAATRLQDRFMLAPKRYRTTFDLSATTEGGDLEHEPVPVAIDRPPTPGEVDRALESFRGKIDQRPPLFSAVKVRGRRAYELAREGDDRELDHRPVTVHDLQLIRYGWPLIELDIACSKGFYVRSLARDLGRALGAGGHVVALRRTAVGPFTESMAVGLEQLPIPLLEEHLINLNAAIAMLKTCAFTAEARVH